ncbi:MAG: 3-(3-hydroxy-phenyl)propionate hydroxylase [Gammaproteobacteria bacterium]|jgi:3-(3-hydroxy-phenyl)propionate hydroxylase
MPAATFDVAIVGMGPVGAITANLLGMRGLSTLIIDKEVDIHPLPRAIAFDHEAMRTMQNCGLASEIEPLIAPYAPSEYRGVDGKVISRFDTQPAPYPLSWSPNYVFRQPPFEETLRDGLRRFPNVEVRTPCELVDLVIEESTVRLSLREGKQDASVCAKYLLAADGGASTVRRLLGITMTSLEFDEPWLVVDVLCSDAALERLPATIIQYCDPARPATYVIGTGNHRRWEIRLLAGEQAGDFNNEEAVWRLLSRWLDRDDGELWRWAPYEFHAVVADEWRRSRVLLLGDAAHMTPPFMAQGMTQGFRDAANLAWKLERIISARAPEKLLDTYMTERAPHVRATTEIAKGLGRVICELDRVAAKARDAKMLADFGDPPRVRSRQSLIPNLGGGLILANTDGAGSIFPQPFVETIGQPKRLDDLNSGEALLVVRESTDLAESWTSITAECARSDLSLIVLSGATPIAEAGDSRIVEVAPILDAWFAEHRCVAAVVRPDHYVFGTTDRWSAVAALCDAWAHSCACDHGVLN